MLEISIFELRNTITELEKRLSSVEDEGNEWKTRYETQVELNRQLERQIIKLQDKMQLVRGNPTGRNKLCSVRTFDRMPVGSLKQILKQLEEEKKSLQNQLKDYELRLEQEAKCRLTTKPMMSGACTSQRSCRPQLRLNFLKGKNQMQWQRREKARY
nr:PREDICTED: coiled-coil domain-containing protein 169 isoform X4 [Struthio camelus australis]